jgi:mono/diheme cytochrome c family protein
MVTLASTLVLGLLGAGAAPGQAPPATTTPEVPGGAALYLERCASCHGTTGIGDGPMADALRHQPADLTILSKANGGSFPSARIYRIIEGRDVPSHGNREMPVWGDVFKTRRPATSRDTSQARIAAIVEYLQSIQRQQGE